MRIMYFGDGEWAHLSFSKIINMEKFEIIGVVLRYENPDSILRKMADERDIPVYTFQNVNSNEFVDFIKEQKIELGVSMSFNQIIGRKLREASVNGFINCHAGKLPYYRGRNILNWALINDEKELGISVHFIDDGIDTGDIISQAVIPIEDQDDYSTILRKAINKCAEVLADALVKIESNNYSTIKHSHISGSYFSYRRNGDELIDWNWTSRRIYNFIRAITVPGPGAYTYLGSEKVIVWKAEMLDYQAFISTPGEIIRRINNVGVVVKTGDTAILIKEVSIADNEEHIIPNFRLGNRLGIHVHEKIFELEEKIKELEKRLMKYE